MQTKDNSNNTLQAFWVMLGSFSAFLVSIVSGIILSRYFDKADYGTYRQILFVYSTLLFIFTAGLPRIFQYYLPRYAIDQGKDIVLKVSKVLFLLGVVFSLFLFFFSDSIAILLNNQELANGLKYFSPIPMLLFPTLGIEGIFSSYRKTKYIAKYNIITRVLQLVGIVIPVIFFNGDYISAIIGWIIASVITLIIAWHYKQIPFKGITKFEKSHLTFKEIFSYSLPLVVASVAGIAIKSADQFYISRYFGPEAFAEFANGFMELPFVSMITGATSTVIMPLFSKMFFNNEGVDNVMQMWRRALMKSAIFIYPLVIFCIAFAKDIMEILYTSKYSSSGVYFQINLFLNFFNIVIFAPLFFSMGKTKLYAKVHIILAIVIWILDYLLIKIFMDPIIIAVSSTLIHIIKTFWFLFLASKLLKVSFLDFFPLWNLSKLTLHSCVSIICILFIINYIHFSDILFVKLMVSSILYGLLILISAPIFKINYLENLNPLIRGFRKAINR